MERPEPQQRQLYRHYKGTAYRILAIATDQSSEVFVVYLDNRVFALSLLEIDQFTAKHEKTGQEMLVQRQPDGSYTIAFYEGNTNPIAWARPFDDFVGVVGTDEGTHFHRFERVLEPG